ncbi:MAG: hypothetical protein HRU19_04760 [Pseudobacteriovorax sp.]|nr:hypothetical protein [Pseudobacteriovorax sp.]
MDMRKPRHRSIYHGCGSQNKIMTRLVRTRPTQPMSAITFQAIVMAKEFLELLFANKSIQNQLNLVTKAQKTTNWRKAADTKDYKTA